jgi:cytochrome c-type biogenesis protein CcmE
MSRAIVKYVAAGTVAVGALAYLAYASLKDEWVSYHVTVDEFATKGEYRTQRVRLAGRVADEGLVTGAGRLGASFVLKGQSSEVNVNYKGVLPDLFKGGCEVIAEGRMDGAGVFRAELIMTKCASKYESDGKGHPEKSNPHK